MTPCESDSVPFESGKDLRSTLLHPTSQTGLSRKVLVRSLNAEWLRFVVPRRCTEEN